MLEKRGKLQLQLYMLAARELWGHELAGGLYRPLGATGDRSPKGLLRKELAEELAGLDPRPNDHLDDEAFDAVLDEAAGEGRGDHRLHPLRQGDPRPARRQLPRLLLLPADLPAGARAAGGGALVRGG